MGPPVVHRCVSAGIGVVCLALLQGTAAGQASPAAVSLQPPALCAGSGPPGPAGRSFREAARRTAPAVVVVSATGVLALAEGAGGADLVDPLFPFVPGERSAPEPSSEPMPEAKVPFRTQGSGFIVREDGLVLTSAHVVHGARLLTVTLADRRTFDARLVGVDRLTDVAVLRIEATGLPVVCTGDARLLEMGDPVLAIGSPFGLAQSATQGVVSAVDRWLPGDAAVPYIQTDAALNPGSSGGPLLGQDGTVVAINAQIFSGSGGYQGLGFSIPIDVALRSLGQILAKGRAEHAVFGAVLQDLDQHLAQAFGLAAPDGALVCEVGRGSAAALAGLLPGDVILAVDDGPVLTPGDLYRRLDAAAPGATWRLALWRDRARRELRVTLDMVVSAPESTAAAVDMRPGAFGLKLHALEPARGRALNLDHGLVVDAATGAAAAAGLVRGDVLLAVNGTPLRDERQLDAAADAGPGVVALLVLRHGGRGFVPVRLR
ncbi:hypothetical protein RD110_08725 [Rhodoferax koreense]|uniref:PDZ domain-containing protein n=2 Tax=Rhodoferax koreensis TaxID=1842727 RepID=A0A1P8JU20_9BURK|nr:hypothetical protein RD110_08725 [Rhodoferax koreense]